MTKIVLGIESSCDETAIAILSSDREVLGNSLKSQTLQHAPYGGVVPDIASRGHLDVISSLLREVLSQSGVPLSRIDGFASTSGPGLAGGLMIGTMAAKTLSIAHRKPFIAVNHLEAHALVTCLENRGLSSFLLLLVSGGHCLLAEVKRLGKYNMLGQSLDDAVGEAFDKVARVLGLTYPGGPEIERIAKHGNHKKFDLPTPMSRQKNCNFSFSGIKTSVVRMVKNIGRDNLSFENKADIAAVFQHKVVGHLISRTKLALSMKDANNIVISEGVASNSLLREEFEKLSKDSGCRLYVPEKQLCTDNAVMVAWCGLLRLLNGESHPMDNPIRPRWPLTEMSEIKRLKLLTF